MNTVVNIAFVAVIAFLLENARAAEPQDTAKLLNDAHEKCQANPATSISNEDGRKLVNDEPLDESVYRGYVTCISANLNLQEGNGQPNVEVIKDILNRVIEDKQKTDQFYDKCSVEKNSRVQIAKAIYLCFHHMLEDYGIHD